MIIFHGVATKCNTKLSKHIFRGPNKKCNQSKKNRGRTSRPNPKSELENLYSIVVIQFCWWNLHFDIYTFVNTIMPLYEHMSSLVDLFSLTWLGIFLNRCFIIRVHGVPSSFPCGKFVTVCLLCLNIVKNTLNSLI